MKTLKVGDKVLVRGGFGADPERISIVTEITLCPQEGMKSGIEVQEAFWSDRLRLCVTLGRSWAYGYQIRPFEGM